MKEKIHPKYIQATVKFWTDVMGFGVSDLLHLTLDPSTGVVRIDASQLDASAIATYYLIVQATDVDGNSDYGLVTVNVTKVDHAPTLSAQSFTVTEERLTGDTVGTVAASEPPTNAPPSMRHVLFVSPSQPAKVFPSKRGIVAPIECDEFKATPSPMAANVATLTAAF